MHWRSYYRHENQHKKLYICMEKAVYMAKSGNKTKTYSKDVQKSSKNNQQLIKIELLRHRGCFCSNLCEKCDLYHGFKSKKVPETYAL